MEYLSDSSIEHNLFSDDDTDEDRTYDPSEEVRHQRRPTRWINSHKRRRLNHGFLDSDSDEDEPRDRTEIDDSNGLRHAVRGENSGTEVVQHIENNGDEGVEPNEINEQEVAEPGINNAIGDRQPELLAIPTEESCSRKRDSRKKYVRKALWKRNKSHEQRIHGLQYTDRKGIVHRARQVQDHVHNCRYKCNEMILQVKREEIFNEYWHLGDYNLQTAFIFSCISIKEPARKKEDDNTRNRKVSVEYTLVGERVCKDFFCKTLDESRKRVDNVVLKKKTNRKPTGVPPKDQRGKKEPANKMPQERVEFVKNHIGSIPKYVSHYTRARHPTQTFMSSNLNIKKLYGLYKDNCETSGILPVTESFYRYIFTHCFNIKFKKPHTDTCSLCDKLQIIISDTTKSDEDKSAFKLQKKLHLKKVENVRQAKLDAITNTKDDDSTVVISFDLQKTLPTPNLTCSKVFYSRQLWTYNFCVHDIKNGKSAMFMWHEAQAGRGCEAIASCLLKYIKSLPPAVTKIIAFSDNCGGQNKSAMTIRFWSYVVSNSQIESVEHHFFVPGHSFMECDQDFSVIENSKKTCEREVYIPEHWREVVARASRRFLVVQMESCDFVSLETLQTYFIDKVTGIQKMMIFHLTKNDFFTLKYKLTASSFEEYAEMNLRLPSCGRKMKAYPELTCVSQKNKPIKAAKYKDLQKLLDFVPPVYHKFYKTLPVQTTTTTRKSNKSTTKKEQETTLDETVQLEELDKIFDTDESDEN